MKNKNIFIIGAAASLCIVSVLLLLGFMGIYAEESSSATVMPYSTESGNDDTLIDVLKENTPEEPAAQDTLRSEKELRDVWEQMYADYDASYPGEEEQNQQFVTKIEESTETQPTGTAAATPSNISMSEDPALYLPNDAELGVSEAGMIALKEIDRLFPGSDLGQLHICEIALESDVGTNSQSYVEWNVQLDNSYEIYDEKYISYDLEIDAITGKITSFSRFYPYRLDGDYYNISWTDEQILERAKELMETYHLADDVQLDWSTVKLFNGTQEKYSLIKELEEEPEISTAITNVLIFQKDGKKQFYFSMDFQTGEIADYIWPGRSMPLEMNW